MATVYLKPGKEGRALGGYLWVFKGEIARIDGRVDDGGIVDLRAHRGKWIGRGFLNRRSNLAVRVLTSEHDEIDDAFYVRRLRSALAYRQRLLGTASAYRVVYSEGDFLPGLIVDRYGDVVVVQTLALGMDVRKSMLVDLLTQLLRPAAVYERNDPPVRALEGLPSQVGWLRPAPDGAGLRSAPDGETHAFVQIEEGQARLWVDIARGQKTGFYLDQRENRLAAASLLRDAEVLDAFCYTGAFSIQAALAGARRVTGIDVSEEAVALAGRHAQLNGVADRTTFVVGNVFDELRRLSSEGRQFDAVILDPPPFARSKAALPRAMVGHKEINLRALKLLRPGGLLLTCSCSHHMTESLLVEVVAGAAADARRRVQLIERRGQARDHPIHPAMPETRYLTCLILEVYPH